MGESAHPAEQRRDANGLDIPVQNMQSIGIFQYEICSQSSTKYAVNRDIPVRNIQSGIFQYEICKQLGYSSTKYAVSRDIPVQTMQSVRIFQYEICKQ